jgi:hypothetical protein
MCMCIKNCLTLYPQPSSLWQPFVLAVQYLILVTLQGSHYFNTYFYRPSCSNGNASDLQFGCVRSESRPGPTKLTVLWLWRLVPASHYGGLSWIPGRSMWEFWWILWQWHSIFSEYFGFLLSVSFLQCSLLVCNSCTTDFIRS